MAGTLTYGRNTLKKTYQSRSQPKSWYQQAFSDTQPAEWFDKVHAYRISAEPCLVRNPFEVFFDYGQYDEDEVVFAGETSKAVNFNLSFDGTPFVTVTATATDEGSNVNVFVTTPTTNGMVINTSAPYTGTVTYRAIYSSTYPVYVRRAPLHSTETYYASAGAITPASPEFTLSFSALDSTPTALFLSPVDSNNNGMANVAVVSTGSIVGTTMPVSTSALLLGQMHYLIAVPQ